MTSISLPDMPYEATVDLSRLRSLVGKGYRRLKKNFGLSWWNRDINPETFPLEGEEFRLNVGFTFVHLNRNKVKNEEVLAAMEREGLRPATFTEFLAFMLKYRELGMKFPIAALGSVGHIFCFEGFPVFFALSPELYLSINYSNHWDALYRFLAVRK
jgi:hypothetical protein